MMETKGKVDVLDDMFWLAHPHCTPSDFTRFRAAINAVAELIEAADAIAHQDHSYVRGMVQDVSYAEVKRLRAALSALRSSQGGREGDEGEG